MDTQNNETDLKENSKQEDNLNRKFSFGNFFTGFFLTNVCIWGIFVMSAQLYGYVIFSSILSISTVLSIFYWESPFSFVLGIFAGIGINILFIIIFMAGFSPAIW